MSFYSLPKNIGCFDRVFISTDENTLVISGGNPIDYTKVYIRVSEHQIESQSFTVKAKERKLKELRGKIDY